MATNKPKVQGYLEQRNFDALEAYRLENNLSLSQALDIVVAGFFKLNQDIPDPKDIHAKKITELEESIESLNQLCKYSFRIAFARIGRLEQSNSLEITSDIPNNGDSLEITSDTPDDRLVICKLYKNNADDPDQWRFWAGFTEGFTGNLKLAKKYKNEAAVNRQIKAIAESDHAASSHERISWRSYSELLQATAIY